MPASCKASKLYLVATPIGNLSDFSPRGRETLENCDLIACEDTRITAKLLAHLSIRKPLLSYREENERKQAFALTEQIKQGKSIALISDAGHPNLSDPGFRLVRECRRAGVEIVPVPGPSAAMTALIASGLPTHQFLFLGFLPKKASGILKVFEEWRDFEGSIVFYESKYKILKTLELIRNFFEDDRHISVAREMTKVHESITSGPVSEVIEKVRSESAKGEFTLIVGPAGFAF